MLETLSRRDRYEARSILYKLLLHASCVGEAGLLAGTFVFMLCLICALMETNQMWNVAERQSLTPTSKECVQLEAVSKGDNGMSVFPGLGVQVMMMLIGENIFL